MICCEHSNLSCNVLNGVWYNLNKVLYKSKLPSFSDICKTVVAFANDAGCILLIGIQDNPCKIVGIDQNDLIKLEERISNIIHDNSTPSILPEIMFLKYEDKHIISVRIYRGNNPPYTKP